MPEMTAQEKQRELTFMQQVAGWPYWPVLPLKRYKDRESGHGVDLEVGVLWSMDFDGRDFLWFEGVAIHDAERLKTLTVQDGTSINKNQLQELLLDKGWIVD